MAVGFGGPVSDADILSLRIGAIPNNTKATTDWGIRVWNEWAASRATTKDKYSYCFVVHIDFVYAFTV